MSHAGSIPKKKSTKGSVQFKNTKGRLQIVFSYPVKVDGEIRRKRFYISTGHEDTPANRYRVGDIVKELQRDIDYGEVDLSLGKYKPVASLTKDFKKHRNHISRLPGKSLDDAIAIRNHLMSSLTPNAAKRCLTQFKACCSL